MREKRKIEERSKIEKEKLGKLGKSSNKGRKQEREG